MDISMTDVNMQGDSDKHATWLSKDEDGVQESENEQETEDATIEGTDADQPATRYLATPSFVRFKKEAASKLSNGASDLPSRQRSTAWSIHPDGMHKHFDFMFPSLSPDNGLYYSPRSKLLSRKSKKRDSDGNVKEMNADLNSRANFVISRKSSPCPRRRSFDRAASSLRFWQRDTLSPSSVLFRPASPMSPRRRADAIQISFSYELGRCEEMS